MKLGIFTIPACLTSYYDAVDWAKENGFDALEPYPALEFAVPGAESIEAARRLGAHAREMGIAIPCFSMYYNIAADPEGAVNYLKSYIDIAAAMGSPLFHHTTFPSTTDETQTAYGALDTMTQRAVKVIGELAAYAALLGVKLCYEDQAFVFNGVYRFGKLLDALGDRAGVVADLGNIFFADERPENFIRAFRDRILHIHVKDYLYIPGTFTEGERTKYGCTLRETLVGDGSVDFPAVCAMLKQIGYDGVCSLEYCVNGEEAPRLECARRFREFWDRA